jgi:hypothetical protein
MALVPPPQDTYKRIEELGAKLAEFVGKHPGERFSGKEVIDAQTLSPYILPFAHDVIVSLTYGTLSQLQLYIDCKVVENLAKLLQGLSYVCVPLRCDDVCRKGVTLYASAFAALTRMSRAGKSSGDTALLC